MVFPGWHALFSFERASEHRPSGLRPLRTHRAYSSVGSERTPDKREVGSSNLPRPTILMVGVARGV